MMEDTGVASESVRMGILRPLVVTMALGWCSVSPVRAGMFENVVEALRFSGFTLDSDHNELSNTSVAVAGTTFAGNAIDLGDFNVSLAGPVAAVVQMGGRGIPTFDLTLSTGALDVNPNGVTSVGPPQPLTYALSFDSGTNTTNIDGNVLMDARFSINAFGSYDLRLQFSDRQTTTIDGRFDDNSPIDFNVDLGPVDIEGNIFADLLAVVTDPFFEATGTENIFAAFSGLGILRDGLGDLSFVSAASGNTSGDVVELAARSVPEPATILLLALVSPIFLRRRRT